MATPDIKSESPQEALERFEEAVRTHERKECSDHHYIDEEEASKNYEEAKAEMLWWIKYIP